MFLDRFKESPKDKLLLLIIIIGLVIVLLVYILIFLPIETSVSTYGILDYEFAWTQDRAEKILSVWGVQGRNKELLGIYWDFLFIIGYISLAFGLIVLILRKSEGKIQKLGIYFILVPFLTGFFDIIENINLLVMLSTPTSFTALTPFIASISALIKFGFLFTAIIYFIAGLIILIMRRVKKSEEK